MSENYILAGTTPVQCEDITAWAKWFAIADRIVAKTKSDDEIVSTVFLGINHGWSGEEPLLFETVVFGGPHDLSVWRYSTWNDAINGHADVCKLIGC